MDATRAKELKDNYWKKPVVYRYYRETLKQILADIAINATKGKEFTFFKVSKRELNRVFPKLGNGYMSDCPDCFGKMKTVRYWWFWTKQEKAKCPECHNWKIWNRPRIILKLKGFFESKEFTVKLLIYHKYNGDILYHFTISWNGSKSSIREEWEDNGDYSE